MLGKKENALRIIRFDNPEYVMTGPPCRSIGYFGVNHEGFEATAGHDVPAGTRWNDIWGTGWHKELPGVMAFPMQPPLADISALSGYRWPDADDERICARIYEEAAGEPVDDRFLTGSQRDTLWEKSYMLVGMENMMTYFFTEPAYVREILHRIMDFQLGIARHYLGLGAEMVQMSDDLGTQSGPLLGPRILIEFLLPEYRRLFTLYKEAGVIIDFHSCGAVEWALDILMDLGVDILNPVQATANDLDAVRRRTQGRTAIKGAVSSSLVVDGPVSRIEECVRERIGQLGREGGYFCTVDQGMPWPPEHRLAVDAAVERYGKYPLTPPRTTSC